MFTDFFYAELPVLEHFWDVSHSYNFTDVPRDWYILITDVVGSTEAIANGRYKSVTLLGACSIAAVLNLTTSIDLPFVFGGDGATLLVPPSLLNSARGALSGLRRIAHEEFGLDLRVGVVPVVTVLDQQYAVKIAKVKVSKHYHQANFWGGGLLYATTLVKDPSPKNPYQFKNWPPVEPNLSGLECRWQDIRNESGQVVSLIVTALPSHAQPEDQVYEDVFNTLHSIYGTADYNPISPKHLRLSFNPKKLLPETQMRSPVSQGGHKARYWILIWLQNLLGWMLMRWNLNIGGTDWGSYKDGLVNTSDYQKFDDMLRMVIASKPEQTQQLLEYLEAKFRTGNLAYGIHISDRALLTCLVYERNGRQIHFVDGADGGYTLAARSLKQQLHRKAQNWRSYSALAQSWKHRARPVSKS
ncbi:MAG: DUF3095 domain-containing protein [Elainellaceae cyanobacterium]